MTKCVPFDTFETWTNLNKMVSHRKVNIVYILTKLELGGAQKHTLDLIKGLDKNTFRVYLITSNGLLTPEAEEIPHLNIILIDSLKSEINLIDDLKSFFKIYRILKVLHADIVHTHSSKTGFLGRWAAWFVGVPIIIHSIHGFEFNEYQCFLTRRFYIFLEMVTALITDRLIAVSEDTLKRGLRERIGTNNHKEGRIYLLSNMFKELFKIFIYRPDGLKEFKERDSHRYIVIKYGISKEAHLISGINVGSKKEELGIEKNIPVVGTISCLKPQKSPFDFVKAASIISRRIPGVRFILVGDGCLKKGLLSLIDSFGLKEKIILTGFRKDAVEIMSVFDIFVLTSLWEGLPIVFLEAMALSKPIIATDTGSSSELVRDGINGYLVKPKDYIGLAEKVILLLENKKLSTEMGIRGNVLFKESGLFTEKMLSQINCLYENLLEKFTL